MRHIATLKLLSLFISFILLVNSAQAEPSAEKGKAVYNGMGACMTCHGALGEGDGAAAAALPVKPASFASGVFKYDTDGDGKTGTAEDIYNIITNGAAKYGGNMMMAARADLSEEDRRSIALYVLSLKK